MPTSSRPLLRRVAALAAASLLLAATGCADQGGPTDVATGAEARQLDVGQISDSVAFFPLFVAEDQGFFTAEGLTLGERPRLGTGAKLAATLQSGSIEVGAGVMTDAFNLYQTNDKARIIGSLVNEYYVDVITGAGIPTALDSAPLAQKVQGLKGKNVGITGPGSGTEALMTYLLKQQGLDAKLDVTLVNLGADASAAIGALKAGRVDALSFFQPIGQQAEVTGVGRIFISPARGDVPQLTGATHGVIFTTQQVLDSKSKAVAAFVRAIAQAEKLITDEPAKAQELLVKYQSALNPDTAKAVGPVLQDEIPASPAMTEEGYRKSADFHQQSGLVPSPPAYDVIVPADFG